VESVFAHLDLNIGELLWHSLNFGLVLAGLWWLVFRPITRLLDERERRVRESLSRAEEIDRLAEQAEAERRELLTTAHREAAAIRTRADEQARLFLVRARAEARDEANRILERAAQLAAAR
jgi:F-type H+-transporting ATPase subunit b